MAGEWLDNVNKPNFRNRGDYGVRVARPGFDARICAQNQLLFNSGWAIMQIVKLVDFSKAEPVEICQKITTVNYTTFNPYETTTTETIEPEDSIPAGLSGITYNTTLTDFKAFSVNRKYVRKDTGEYTQYFESSNIEQGDNYYKETLVNHRKLKMYQMKHGLDYVPFFLPGSALFGGNSSQVLLFSIDIESDVDYPYTEEALPMIGLVGDYGIKSESEFGENVPGLCSNMFSKLVQAVKTTETSTFSVDGIPLVFWSPLAKGADVGAVGAGCLLPFEIYGFTGDGNKKGDGGQFYTRFAPTFISDASPSGAVYNQAYAAGIVGQSPQPNGVLVVLRSPMVSPEYEEI